MTNSHFLDTYVTKKEKTVQRLVYNNLKEDDHILNAANANENHMFERPSVKPGTSKMKPVLNIK